MDKKERQERKELAFAMFAKGHTYAEIGKALGTSRQYAQQLTRPPIQVINALRRRAGNKCERCRIPLRVGDFHVHHIENEITGRFDDLKRVRLLCRSCHRVEDYQKDPDKFGGWKRGEFSFEHRKKMSEAQYRRWARIKEENGGDKPRKERP